MEIKREVTFRSNPLVDMTDDMVSVTLVCPRHEWREMKENLFPQQAVKADACLCTELKDGADACPYWVAWGKCKKRTA